MSALVLAPLVIAVVLIVSGLAKLHRPEEAASAFTSLRLPAWLDQPIIHRALPWGELVLAIALLPFGGLPGLVVAVLALLLMLAYTLVIARALTFDHPVDCGCFGRLGMGEVTHRTLWRNVLLTTIAAAGVAFAATSPNGAISHLANGGPTLWSWILGTAMTAGVAVLILEGRPHTTPPHALEQAEGGAQAGPEDYVRHPTPPAALLTSDGQAHSIRDLARGQAQLLVFVSPSCGSCTSVIEQLGTLRQRLGPVALRDVYTMTPQQGQQLHEQGLITNIEHALFDPDRMLATALEISGTPTAVLLGTDDRLAGGPVVGTGAVLEFIDAVATQLAETPSKEETPTQ